MLRNKVREVLDAGGRAIGTWVEMKNPEACEAAAASGFDFIVMDGEHGSFGVEGAVELIRAVEAGGSTPVLRLPDGSPTAIQKALEAGAVGIFISEVRTGEEVRGLEAQTRQCLDNIKEVLEAAGSSLKDVVKVNVYLRNADDFARMNEVYESYFTEDHPTRCTVVPGLANPNMLIEIECIAYCP